VGGLALAQSSAPFGGAFVARLADPAVGGGTGLTSTNIGDVGAGTGDHSAGPFTLAASGPIVHHAVSWSI